MSEPSPAKCPVPHGTAAPEPAPAAKCPVPHGAAAAAATSVESVEVFRCFGDGDPLYEHYHDHEWGVPVTGDRALFERMALESFQSGLAWITILRKRDNFRAAFAGFDHTVVAEFDDDDVARLMADTGIVRNRAKIEATVANARAICALHDSGSKLTDLIWSYRPETPRGRPTSSADFVNSTEASVALAKRLKSLGFRFLGPTTVYAGMQACGLVNDHLVGCPAGDRLEA